jgi:hypothetical protein
VLTWVVAGVGCWLLGNVAFVLWLVRCRDQARRYAVAGGAATHGERPATRGEDAAGRPPLRLAAPGRGGR